MSKIIVSCVLCVTAFCAQSAVYQVPDGTEISVSGVSNGKFSVGGVEYGNNQSTVLDFAGDATIKVAYAEGTDSGFACFGIIATNGTVTLDLTAIEGKEFTLENGASVEGKGKLVVKGRDSLRVGNENGVDGNYAPPAGIENIEYRDSDNVAYQSPEGLILVGHVLEWKLPVSTPWKLDADALPCVAQKNSKIIESMIKDGVVTLENRDMWIYETDVFPATTTPVSVGVGSELVVILRKAQPEKYFEQAGYSGHTLRNPICISGGGVLNMRSHNLTFSGSITGTGTLRYTETKDGYWTKVADASGFSGHVSCERPNTTLQFGNASFGGDVSMTLCDGSAVELGYNAEDGYATTIGAVVGPESGSASLAFPSEKSGTVTIASKTGNVLISGGGYEKTTVMFPSIAVGETLVADGNETLKLSLPDDFASRSDVFVLTRSNGRNVYVRSASSESVDFLDFDVPATGVYKLVAKNGVTYANVPENVQVTVPEGVDASVSVANAGKSNIRMEGGNLAVSRIEHNWRDKVVFWIDPSKLETATLTNEYKITLANDLWVRNATYPTVGTMVDARDRQGSVKLFKQNDTVSTWPILVTNAMNNLSFLSMVYDGLGNRRLRIVKSDTEDYGYFRPAFAIMVFGSQFGGGKAVIGNESGYFQRGGEIGNTNDRIPVTNPIFANGDIATWVNGETVDPSKRGLSGGWEILSIDTSGAVVHGLGFNNAVGTTSNTKGQNYGEVLFFSTPPTAEERIAAEKYLAEKWGLIKDYKDDTSLPELRITGNGSVVLKDDFAVSGSFSGSVDLNGKSIVMSEEPLPPGDSVVGGTAPLAWFDPEAPGMMEINGRKVNYILDRMRGDEDGAPVLNSSGRPPLVISESRGFGPSRKWLDYSPYNFWDEKNYNYGRTMRLNKLPTLNITVVPLSARTVFLVQDSIKGGGTPFLSAVGGSGDLIPRLTQWPSMPPDPGLPVWRGTTASIFAEGGATYLDGRKVDGAVEGFQGRPELLTAVGNRNFTLGTFAYYDYLDLVVDKVDAGEVQGEIIVYDKVLEDDVRKSIEAYLMWKWLGVARDGYSVAANMTLIGNGSVTIASKEQMPKFDAQFTGAAALGESAFDFTVNADGTVSGLIDVGSAKISFPAACTANVSFADGMKVGTYPLIKGGEIAPETSWTLNLVNGGSRKAAISQNGGMVALEVRSPGTVVTVR